VPLSSSLWYSGPRRSPLKFSQAHLFSIYFDLAVLSLFTSHLHCYVKAERRISESFGANAGTPQRSHVQNRHHACRRPKGLVEDRTTGRSIGLSPRVPGGRPRRQLAPSRARALPTRCSGHRRPRCRFSWPSTSPPETSQRRHLRLPRCQGAARLGGSLDLIAGLSAPMPGAEL
jgi:hypothetical protein